MPQEKVLASGWFLQHLMPIDLANLPDLSEEDVKFFARLPSACILSGERSGREGKQISLDVSVNGVVVVVAQIPYTEGDDQALLSKLFQQGADFLKNTPKITPRAQSAS